MVKSFENQPWRMLRYLLLSLLLLSPLARAADVDAATAWKKINAGALLVDVRTPEEFAAGHLPNAINIPHEKVVGELAKRGISKDAPLVLYCRSGRRSGVAEDALAGAGYQQLYNAGGYQSLLSAQPPATAGKACGAQGNGKPC